MTLVNPLSQIMVMSATYASRVPKYDPAELVDATEVARMLGLSRRNAVSVYRSRYDDFPEPVVDLGKGRCVLWLRRDIERWHNRRP